MRVSEKSSRYGVASDRAPDHHAHLAAIGLVHGLSHTAPVKAAHYRLDAEPYEGNISAQHMERTAFRIWLTIHPPLEAKAGVKAAAG
ncbi:MAG TPA: hypothetical protein VGU20_02665 [Stellaceae bacterium]|nr:hypothetical protein [Stellaceae bacterium]